MKTIETTTNVNVTTEAINAVIRKEQEMRFNMINMTKIIISHNAEDNQFVVNYELIPKPESLFLQGMDAVETIIKTTKGGTQKALVLADALSVKGADYMSRALIGRGLTIKFDGEFRAYGSHPEYKGGATFELRTGEIVPPIINLEKFGVVAYAPAQEKNKEAIIAPLNEDTILRIDRVSYGAYSILKNRYGVVNFATAVKRITSRLSQPLAPTVIGGRGEADIAIFFGKEEFSDGEGVLNIKYFPDIARILGSKVQARPSTSKAGFPVREGRYVNKMMSKYDIIYLTREEAEKAQDELENCFFGKGKFTGKVVVISDNPNVKEQGPDIYVDLNCLKAAYEFSMPLELPILSITKDTVGNGKVKVSSQMASRLLATREGGNFLARRGAKQIEAELNRVFNLTPKMVSEKEAQGMYVPGIIESAFPEFILQDSGLFKAFIDGKLKTINKRINNFNIELDGMYLVGVVDPFQRIKQIGDENFSLLKDDEFFAQGINTIIKRKENELEVYGPLTLEEYNEAEYANSRLCAVVRHPKPGIYDMPIRKALTISDIRNRLNKLEKEGKISKLENNLIYGAYVQTDKGSIILNSCTFSTVVHSGSDWDQDGFTVVFDREFVELVKNEPVLITSISELEDRGSDVEYKTDISLFSNIWEAQISDDKLSVGQVANLSRLILSLLHDKEAGRNILSKVFKGGTRKYVSPLEYKAPELPVDMRFNKNALEVKMTPSLGKKVIARIEACDIMATTDVEFENIICDLNQLMNMYVQETIDSSKNGHLVVIAKQLLKLRKIVKFLAKEKIELVIEGGVVKIAASPVINAKSGDIVVDGVQEKIALSCRAHIVRMHWVKAAINTANYLLKKEVKYTKEARDMVEFSSTNVPHALVQDLIKMKYLYNNVQALHTIEDENEIADMDIINSNKIQKRRMLQAISDMARTAFELYGVEDPALKGLLAMKASLPGNGGLENSRFAINVLPQEYIAAVAKICGRKAEFGHKIELSKYINDGDIVNIENGNIVSKKVMELGFQEIMLAESKELFELKGLTMFGEDGKVSHKLPFGEIVKIRKGGYVESNITKEGAIVKEMNGSKYIVEDINLYPEYDINNFLVEMDSADDKMASIISAENEISVLNDKIVTKSGLYKFQYSTSASLMRKHINGSEGELVAIKEGIVKNAKGLPVNRVLVNFRKDKSLDMSNIYSVLDEYANEYQELESSGCDMEI